MTQEDPRAEDRLSLCVVASPHMSPHQHSAQASHRGPQFHPLHGASRRALSCPSTWKPTVRPVRSLTPAPRRALHLPAPRRASRALYFPPASRRYSSDRTARRVNRVVREVLVSRILERCTPAAVRCAGARARARLGHALAEHGTEEDANVSSTCSATSAEGAEEPYPRAAGRGEPFRRRRTERGKR